MFGCSSFDTPCLQHTAHIKSTAKTFLRTFPCLSFTTFLTLSFMLHAFHFWSSLVKYGQMRGEWNIEVSSTQLEDCRRRHS